MVHHSEKGSETDKKTIGKYPDGVSSDQPKKTCADCGTTKTPLWRGGPAGPKSLCNACGIRSRKKRRAIVGMNKAGSEDGKSKIRSSGGGGGSKLGDLLKQRLVSLGREVMRQRSPVEKRRSKLREEEQAAVLLMALSYGSVYA